MAQGCFVQLRLDVAIAPVCFVLLAGGILVEMALKLGDTGSGGMPDFLFVSGHIC